MLMKTISRPGQTILLCDQNNRTHDDLMFSLVLAGYNIRHVSDGAEAVNLVNISTVTDEEFSCLLIRFPDKPMGKFHFSRCFEGLKDAGFHLPVLIVVNEQQDVPVRTISANLPKGLDVHFCSASSSLETLIKVSSYHFEQSDKPSSSV